MHIFDLEYKMALVSLVEWELARGPKLLLDSVVYNNADRPPIYGMAIHYENGTQVYCV